MLYDYYLTYLYPEEVKAREMNRLELELRVAELRRKNLELSQDILSKYPITPPKFPSLL
jgi:hypothetical protein